MPVNIGATLNHISRESSDIRRLADFYKEVLSIFYKTKSNHLRFQFFFLIEREWL